MLLIMPFWSRQSYCRGVGRGPSQLTPFLYLSGRAPFVLLARIVLLHVIYLRLQLYLAQRRCALLDELCHNEMSRDHDAPLEYLRILASLKLRFGLATLVTAHGALPVAYPIEEQGHSATQCLRGILSDHIHEAGRLAS